MFKGPTHSFESALHDAVTRLWPDIPVNFTVKPLVDLRLGDLSSDICLRLAQHLACSPVDIANRIIPELWQVQGQVSLEQGYLNYKAQSIGEFLAGEYPVLDEPRTYNIFCPSPQPRLLGVSYLRVLSLAFAQALHLLAIGNKVRIFIGSEEVEVGYLGYRRSLTLTDTQSTAEDFWLKQLQKSDSPNQVNSFWLNERTVTSGCYRELVRDPSTQLHIVTKTKSRLLSDSFVIQHAQETKQLLYYLISLDSEEEFDPSVWKLAEQDNLFWNLKSLFERMSRYTRQINASPERIISEEELNSCLAVERELLLRSKFLPLQLARSGQYGEVEDLAKALKLFTQQLTRYWNNPSFRLSLEQNHIPMLSRQIASGAYRTLSYILQQIDNKRLA